MTSVYPGRTQNQFNLVAQARRQAGLDLQDVRADRGGRPWDEPGDDVPTSRRAFHYQPDPAIPAWDVSTYSHTYSGPITVQQATLQSDNTVYAQLTLDVGPQNVADMAHKLGVQSPLEPVPVDRARLERGLAARHGLGVRDARRRRDLLEADGDPQGDPRERQGGRPAPAGATPQRERVISGRRRLHGDEDPRAERALRDRHARELRPAGRRQDRHDRRPRRRLVLRLPAEPRGDRLGRLPAGRDPDGERARDRRRRRQLPGGDLAAVHGAGVRYSPAQDFPLPKTYPTWTSRSSAAQYAIEYVSTDTTSSTTTDDDHDEARDDGRARRRRNSRCPMPRRADDRAGDDRARPPPADDRRVRCRLHRRRPPRRRRRQSRRRRPRSASRRP